MIELTIEIFLLLFFTGLIAGFIDSIAGGGGLITLPVLLSLGIPPAQALGTNKLQSSFGTFSAALNFIRKKQVSLSEAKVGILFTFLGAIAGTSLVQYIDPAFLQKLIPVLLLIILAYSVITKDLGKVDRLPKMNKNVYFVIFGLLLGFYDGFFGPGTGSFWTIGMVYLIGFNLTKATGYTKVMNFVSNVVAITLFAIGGNIIYKIGLCMASGQVIGSYIGSNMAIKRGASFIRPIFITAVLIMVLRLAYKFYF